MAYDTHEGSTDRGGPITLYEFRVGPEERDVYRFTDADEEVFYEFKPWYRETIQRSDLKQDGTLTKASMVISLPEHNPIPQLYTSYPPSYVVTVRILEGHFEDKDREFITLMTGRVLNCETEGVESRLTCEPASTSLRRPGLRRNYQRQCPLVLYGPQCLAVKAPHTCTLDSVDGFTISGAPAGGLLPAGPEAYAGGVIQWVNPETLRTEIRTILLAEEVGGLAIFSLGGPVLTPPELTFTVLKGCNHTEAACVAWHDNIQNYGGQVWIPLKNPINTISTYF